MKIVKQTMSIIIPVAVVCLLASVSLSVPVLAQQQNPGPVTAPQTQATPSETVRAITPAWNPLPPEDKSADVTRFSFIVYGDTRGRRDGTEVQYEHSLVVDSMLATIKRLEKTA